jgi:predicted KAP-like P-loop ATPase
MSEFHSDIPIKTAESDLYHRTSFADQIISIITDLEISENYVIGLSASWGFGKTSTVNLILEKLREIEGVHGIYINAWACEGDANRVYREILTRTSKEVLGEEIKSMAKWLGKAKRIPGKFEQLGYSVTPDEIAQMLMSFENIDKARDKVVRGIREKNTKVVVFIDDIDRLEGKQTVSIFRLLSSIADYGGMTYVLPFDFDYVCQAVEDALPVRNNGADFLEKIIQIPLQLPMIPQSTIDQVFTGKLLDLFSRLRINVTNDEISRFQTLYYNCGANTYIKSPRDVNRILNTLRASLLMSPGEVNTIDMVILEIIRVFDNDFL